jgi:hypothetical protein
MSLNYDLEIATSLNPKQVLQIIVDELGFTWCEQGNLQGPQVAVSAISQSPLGQSVIEEGFGFRPKIHLSFWISSHANEEEGRIARQSVIRAVMTILRYESGDAVLLFNGENLLLQRLNGNLILNSVWKEWTSYYLFDEITLPCERREIASPLL